jgi:hypothetical protein
MNRVGKIIDIVSWDASYSSYDDPPFNVHPVISFIATPKFIEFSENNNNFIPVNITGTKYTGTWFGWVDQEQRPNYFQANSNKLYNITLNTFWKGYPDIDDGLGKIQAVEGVIVPKYMQHVVNRGHPLY